MSSMAYGDEIGRGMRTLFLLLSACSPSPDAETGVESDSDTAGDGAVDYAEPGRATVSTTRAELVLEDCTLGYDLYAPSDEGPLVVLGHGFARSAAQMAGLGEHLASHGLRVAVPDYCFSSFGGADHPANARHAVALSAALAQGEDVLHIGYSAGGAAAMGAVADDPAAIGVLGLDAVDSDALAADGLARFDGSVAGLVGAPSACNDEGSGASLYGAGEALVVVGASHCDFEDPSDALCTALCGAVDEQRQAVVRELATAWALATSGLDPRGAELWSGGERYDELVSSGLVATGP